MKAVIGTKNQGKIEGARRALAHYFQNIEVVGVPVESNVSEQPINSEIYEGARNRIENLKIYCKENNIDADFYMSIESGIQNEISKENWMITNVAGIESKDGTKSFATSSSFPVPDRLVKNVINTDLSVVMNSIFEGDSQRSKKGGGIQLLTDNVISRIDLTEEAFVMALTKFINGEDWK